MHAFSKKELIDAFHEMGKRAYEEGKVIDIAVYGGSCLMIASNFRVTTMDVDAVAEGDQTYLDSLARSIANERGWPDDWLNDSVRVYLSPKVELFEQHELFGTYPSEQSPGLRVFVPTSSYLLAMKLMSMRLDETTGQADLEDILNLLDVVKLDNKEEIIAFASQFYPEAQISGKLLLALDNLWNLYQTRKGTKHDKPPYYLGRRGPARN